MNKYIVYLKNQVYLAPTKEGLTVNADRYGFDIHNTAVSFYRESECVATFMLAEIKGVVKDG